MGNVTLFGSLCGECSINESDEENKSSIELKEKEIKLQIDQILIKEISERELMATKITNELKNMKTSIDKSLENIKQTCDNQKDIISLHLDNLKNNTTKNVNEIKKKLEKIEENNLYLIEKDINILNTKMIDVNEDIREIKRLINDINKNVIKNTTQLEILNK